MIRRIVPLLLWYDDGEGLLIGFIFGPYCDEAGGAYLPGGFAGRAHDVGGANGSAYLSGGCVGRLQETGGTVGQAHSTGGIVGKAGCCNR